MKNVLSAGVAILTALAAIVALPATGFGQCPCILVCPAGDGGITAPPPGGTKSPDMDGSGAVNLVDLSMFAAAWPPNPYDYCADFDCNGIMTLVDLATFAAHWLHAGPNPGYCQPGIDHYKPYETVGPIFDGPVWLRDQFGEIMVSPMILRKFATPVSKNNQQMCDTLAHQSWWEFRYPEPPRMVVVQNQFGTFEWMLADAVYLINPALKFPRPGHELPILNHYKCYEAQGPPVDIAVRLQDQFGLETVVVLTPAYFCNPCEKQTPDGIISPIIDPDAHITVYLVENPVPHGFQILMRDQFFEEPIMLHENLFLEVPALKREVIQPQE